MGEDANYGVAVAEQLLTIGRRVPLIIYKRGRLVTFLFLLFGKEINMLERNSKYFMTWQATKKFDSGFYGFFEIGVCDNSPANWFNIALSIGKKKKRVNGFFNETKHSNSLTTNIGSGIAPLIWAKDCLLEFEKEIAPTLELDKIYICTGGDDARRFRVYKWALSKIGYTEQRVFNEKMMVKKLTFPR